MILRWLSVNNLMMTVEYFDHSFGYCAPQRMSKYVFSRFLHDKLKKEEKYGKMSLNDEKSVKH